MKTKLLAIVSAVALGVGGITGCSTTTTAARASDPVAKRHSIDSSVDNALSRLYAQDPAKASKLAKTRAEHARVLAKAEEEWLAAGAALETAQA